MITVLEPSWTAPFTGLSPRTFGRLVTTLRREGADTVRPGRPWSVSLEDRAESGANAAVGRPTTIADGGYPGTGLVIPHRQPRGGEPTE